ncbi:uncharacterized protein LOC132746150 [Ruditapes philippinarum]|uniref:uncharacterized protein LOC132746150 n=1 Tax=Ruditapes philippinarum TaxID=129788 RepID=UPI00295B0CE8|nr:uncharacterized protein LOC132746150 [Ruditapes philippinarum]
MGFGQASIMLKVGFILIIVALVIQILAVALPYWYSKEVANNYDVYGGLFRGCAEAGNTKACNNVKNPTDWWAATQAFEIIGLLILVAALILCIIVLFVKDMKILKMVNFILCFCSCGFIIIGVIIYGAESEGWLAEYSGAFALAIIAGIVALVAGVLCLLDWMKAPA